MKEIEIFAIDDDKDMTDLIAMILGKAGFKNFKTFNDPEALIQSLNPNVRICIIDYDLKNKINGLDLIKKIVETNTHCWFIMLSANSDFDVVIDFVNGVYGSRYIKKAGNTPLNILLVKYINDIIEKL